MLELEAVAGRLGTRRSGVFEVEIGGGAEAGGETGWTEPMEDMDTSDDAEPIASTLMFIHSSTDCLREVEGDLGVSLEADLREVKLSARGLSASPPDFDSFMDDCEGDVTSFLPRGLEKLHFLDGVLFVPELVGVVDFREWCLCGVANDGTSKTAAGSNSGM